MDTHNNAWGRDIGRGINRARCGDLCDGGGKTALNAGLLTTADLEKALSPPTLSQFWGTLCG